MVQECRVRNDLKDHVLQLLCVIPNTSTTGLLSRLHGMILHIIFTDSRHYEHRRASWAQAEGRSQEILDDTNTADQFWHLAEIFADINLGVLQGFNHCTLPFPALSFQMLPPHK
jgi:hypothetical protein